MGTPAKGLHSLPSLPCLQRVASRGQAAFTIPGPHNPSAQSSRHWLLQPRNSRSHATSVAIGPQPGTVGSAASQGRGAPRGLHGHTGLGGLDDGHKSSSIPSPPSLASRSHFEWKEEKISNERENGECSVRWCMWEQALGQRISVRGVERASPAPQAGQERWIFPLNEDSKAPEPAPSPGTAGSLLSAEPLLPWASGSLKKASGKVNSVQAELRANTLSPQMSSTGCGVTLRVQGRAGAWGCVIDFRENCLCVWSGSARTRPSSLRL